MIWQVLIGSLNIGDFIGNLHFNLMSYVWHKSIRKKKLANDINVLLVFSKNLGGALFKFMCKIIYLFFLPKIQEDGRIFEESN